MLSGPVWLLVTRLNAVDFFVIENSREQRRAMLISPHPLSTCEHQYRRSTHILVPTPEAAVWGAEFKHGLRSQAGLGLSLECKLLVSGSIVRFLGLLRHIYSHVR